MWPNDPIRHLGRLTSSCRRPPRLKSGSAHGPTVRGRYDNLALHARMQAAEIFKRPSFIKSEAKLVLGVERRRMKRAIYRCNRMRDFIVVLPHHRGSDRDRDGVGLEHEVLDGGASFG